MNAETNKKKRSANQDPITGEPGSHPVGTGSGAAAGGAAGAAIGAAAGPVGAGVGLVAGAVAGGYAGKAIAENIDPTEENAYWQRHYSSRPYAGGNRTYADYESAYRTGWEGYDQYGRQGKRFDDVESDLRGTYEKQRNRLEWEHARPAIRDAWMKLERNLEHLIDYNVVDKNDGKLGTVETVWEDHTGQPAFLGVRTGWLGLGKIHVVPADLARINERDRKIQLPFSEGVLKEAPSFGSQEDVSEENEENVYAYYESKGFPMQRSDWDAAPETMETEDVSTPPQTHASENSGRRTVEEASVPLNEEQIRIGKREVEVGGIRLRKIVRTEVVNQPVELRREEIVIERVPVSEGRPSEGNFETEEELYIPLRREEAVVAKEVRLREEVRVQKRSELEQQNISETVRREDIEVEDTRGKKD